MALEKFYEETSKFIKSVSKTIKKNTPKYAKILQNKANQYGKISIQKVDIQILVNKLNHHYKLLGQSIFQELTPQKISAFSKNIQKIFKEVESLKNKIDSEEKTLKKNIEKTKPKTLKKKLTQTPKKPSPSKKISKKKS